MTPEERALEFLARRDGYFTGTQQAWGEMEHLTQIIREAEAAATARERETCISVVDCCLQHRPAERAILIAAIRARGNP